MQIQTATVIGANGSMGTNISAIFASLGKAKVYMVCRDIEKAKAAAGKAAKIVRSEDILPNLIPADYSMLEKCIPQSDLIFESTFENLEIKQTALAQVEQMLKPGAVICSGTSGLSITDLAEGLSDDMRSRFFGVHIFNPPSSMTLCELTSTKYVDVNIKEELREYLENVLFRSLIETKDSPAFLANRIGFHFINKAMQYAGKYRNNGGIDYIDAILGHFTGRAMAPLAIADFVGLDVHKAIVDNIYSNTNDYSHSTFLLPAFVQQLVYEGRLGKKTGEGLYKVIINDDGTKQILVYDIKTGEFREKAQYDFPFAQNMKRHISEGNYSLAFEALINDHSQEAEICLDFLLNYVVYSFVAAKIVSDGIHSADIAMATGFKWCPPLAMINALSTAADIKALFYNRLDAETLSHINIDEMLSYASESKYDYKPYFKSGR